MLEDYTPIPTHANGLLFSPLTETCYAIEVASACYPDVRALYQSSVGGDTIVSPLVDIPKIPKEVLDYIQNSPIADAKKISSDWRYLDLRVAETFRSVDTGLECPGLYIHLDGGIFVHIAQWSNKSGRYRTVHAAFLTARLRDENLSDFSTFQRYPPRDVQDALARSVVKFSPIEEPFKYLKVQQTVRALGTVSQGLICTLHLMPAVNRFTGKSLHRREGMLWCARRIGIYLHPGFFPK